MKDLEREYSCGFAAVFKCFGAVFFANYLWSVETEPKLNSCVSVHNWLNRFFSGFGTIEQTLQLSS